MWLRLVQSARDKEEQNLEAYVKNGQLFYRSLRRIEKDEELLVWYGKDLTELLLLSPGRAPARSKGEAPPTVLAPGPSSTFQHQTVQIQQLLLCLLQMFLQQLCNCPCVSSPPPRFVPSLVSGLQPAVPVRVPVRGPPAVPLHQTAAGPR